MSETYRKRLDNNGQLKSFSQAFSQIKNAFPLNLFIYIYKNNVLKNERQNVDI